MSADAFIHFCNMFYNCSFIPFHYFTDETLILQQPENEHFLSLVKNYIQPLSSSERQVTYLTTKDFSYYGIVKSQNAEKYIIIGPILSTVCTKSTITSIMTDTYIPHKYLEEVFDLFQLFPALTFLQFLHVLALFNLELNHENMNISEIFDIDNYQVIWPIQARHAKSVYDTKEMPGAHNTYAFERYFLKYVEDGDLEGLKAFLQKPAQLKAGIVADNNLRQIKNLFIVAITTVTRASIRGGLDIEVAYQLSDTYIQQMEKLQDINAVSQLQYAMITDYTRRVSDTKIPAGISSDVYECIQFVSSNTNRPLNVSDVAIHVGKSRSYISKKFMMEMGFGLNAFITRKKLEESKSLLSFTGKSLSEISYYLGFSSQGYFQNVFKKNFGMTPNEYRNRSSH